MIVQLHRLIVYSTSRDGDGGEPSAGCFLPLAAAAYSLLHPHGHGLLPLYGAVAGSAAMSPPAYLQFCLIAAAYLGILHSIRQVTLKKGVSITSCSKAKSTMATKVDVFSEGAKKSA